MTNNPFREQMPRRRRDKSEFNPKVIERYIYNMTNKERTTRQLSFLLRDEAVDSIAYQHSCDMSKRNFFSHTNPDGLSPSDRGKKAGYNSRVYSGNHYTEGLGENILFSDTFSSFYFDGFNTTYAWYENEKAMSAYLMEGWMNSPPHRASILNGSYAKIGVGVYINEKERLFATQNFC